jgi:hypothetical protein
MEGTWLRRQRGVRARGQEQLGMGTLVVSRHQALKLETATGYPSNRQAAVAAQWVAFPQQSSAPDHNTINSSQLDSTGPMYIGGEGENLRMQNLPRR